MLRIRTLPLLYDSDIRENRLNRVLGRIFGPTRDEVRGEWRRIHNQELYSLYSSRNIRVIKWRIIRWVGRVARNVETRHAYRVK